MPLLFHGFELDFAQGRLLRDGHEVALEPRAFDLLCYLADNSERLVTKDELMREVWRAHSLSSGVMGNAVAKLRRALGQASDASRPIETVHGRGYRFWPAVREGSPPSAAGEDTREPFLGRARVLETLEAALEAARAGRSSVTVLAGSAGIGKTRTARELTVRARRLGFRCFYGAAYDGETRAPYWPFTQLLRQAREELGRAGFAAHLPAGALALGLVLPELSSPSELATSEPASVRVRLFDEVVRVLGSLAAEAPLLLVFDDLHWADRAAIELVHFTARALEQRRVAIVANLRDDELQPGDERNRAVSALDRIATRVTLAGLSLDQVGELSAALGSPLADASALQLLHARTGGNPFFVRQLVESALAGDIEQVPAAVRGVLQAKIARLAPRARESAGAAAVIGPDFTLSAVAALRQRTPESVLEDIESLELAGVIEHGRGSELFTFTHALLREALYAELSVRTRGALHLRAARFWQAKAAGEPAAEIAHHYLHALPSQLSEAAAACRRAAKGALESGGFEASARLLALAIDKLTAEHGEPQLACELYTELGTSHIYALDIDRAWQAYRSAAELAERLGRTDLSVQLVPHLVNCIELIAGDAGFVRELIERTLRLLPPEQRAERANLLAHLAELASELPAPERSGLLDEAERLAAESGEVSTILEVAHSRCNLRDPTMLEHNRAAADRLLALIDEHRSSQDNIRYRLIRRMSAWITHYVSALSAGHIAQADRVFESIEALGRTSGTQAVLLTADFMRAGRALAAGRLEELDAIVQRGLALQQEFAARAALVFGRYAFALARERGVLSLFASLDLEAVPVPSVTRRQATDAAIVKAHAYALTGRPERAASALASIPADALARMPVLFGDLGLLCQLAETCSLIGQRELAARAYAQLQPHASKNALLPHFESWGAVAHFLGLLARLLGDRASARSHFEQALALNKALGMPLQVAATQRELGAVRDCSDSAFHAALPPARARKASIRTSRGK